MTGQGTFTWPSGSKYVGNFENGNCNGFGTKYDKNGNIFQKGQWKDDNFIGN